MKLKNVLIYGLNNLKRNNMREVIFALFGIIVGLFIRFCIIEQFKKK